MGIISVQLKILGGKTINLVYLAQNFQIWKRARLALQLFFQSLHVIVVNMCITQNMDEITRLYIRENICQLTFLYFHWKNIYLQIGDMSHHVCQQRITCNVKWHTQTHIS